MWNLAAAIIGLYRSVVIVERPRTLKCLPSFTLMSSDKKIGLNGLAS